MLKMGCYHRPKSLPRAFYRRIWYRVSGSNVEGVSSLKQQNLSLFLVLVLPVTSGGWLLAQDDDPCRPILWDTVTNGTAFQHYLMFGQCEYEVDTGASGPEAYLQVNVPDAVEAQEDYRVRMLIDASRLNRKEPGHFRVMSIQVSENPELLFALDLRWLPGIKEAHSRLFLEGSWVPFFPASTRGGAGFSPPRVLNLIHDFQGWIDVELILTQSSAPDVTDGRIELWVDGIQELVWSRVALDWTQARFLDSVRYGVIQRFEPKTSGVLRFIPIRPAPYAITF